MVKEFKTYLLHFESTLEYNLMVGKACESFNSRMSKQTPSPSCVMCSKFPFKIIFKIKIQFKGTAKQASPLSWTEKGNY